MAISVPQWFEVLIEEAAGGDLRWYTPAEREARFAAARDRPFDPGYQWLSEETVALATVLGKDKLPVGEGPPLYLTLGTEVRVRCWLDLRAPDQLWLSLDRQPPFLWIPAGREAAGVYAALAPYLPADLRAPRPPEPLIHAFARQRAAQRAYTAPPAAAATQTCRLLLGVTLDESDLDLVQVENHLTMNPFCDAEFVFQGTADWNTQENPTVSVVRTNYSRSPVRLLWYESLAGTLFAEIDYTAAGQAAVITAYNQQFDQHYPADIPVDVPAMLLGFDAVDVPQLQRQIQEVDDPALLHVYLDLLGILTYPDLEPYLQPYSRHPAPDVRGVVVAIAEQNDLHALLRTMLERESNSLIRTRIAAALTG